MSRPLFRRRTLRFRLTLTYTALFLAAGAVLLGATYGLVAHSLPNTKTSAGSNANLNPALQLACKTATDANLIAKCKLSDFQNGVAVGATTQRDAALRNLLTYSLIALLAMTLASGGIGWFIAGKALRPVQAITAAARRASGANLHERIALDGPPDELTDLADTFDEMLSRLDAAFSRQRRFVADASHELRTPLTVMRTAIEVTLAKAERTPAQLAHMALEIRDAVDRAEALIDALLALARSDRGAIAREPLDLAVIAEDAIDNASTAISQAGLSIEPWLDPAITLGDPVLVDRMIANMLDNAVKHNTRNGWIRLATGTRGGQAFVTLSNTGPVISDDQARALFEPFRRLEGRTADGSGTGLGLAIVHAVATAHHGHAQLRTRTGGGLDVTVELPADTADVRNP